MAETQEQALTDGIETTISETETVEETPTIPDGFDDKLYDTESQTLRIDAVRERFESDTKERESLKKQVLDLRRKISKGHEVPESVDKYDFTPDAKYDKYTLDEESNVGQHIKGVMENISKFSFDNGLTKQQDNALKAKMLEYMESVKILDTRSDEDIERERQDAFANEARIIGDNYKDIVKNNVDFYKERGPFTPDERKYILDQLSHSGHSNNIFRKMIEIMNTGSTYDIPTSSNVDTNVEALRKEYADPTTSVKRREEIIKRAFNEGWNVI